MALVEVASFQDLFAAEIVKGRLESEGIETVLFDGGLSSLGLGTMSPARLMVDESDSEAALRLISAGDAGRLG